VVTYVIVVVVVSSPVAASASAVCWGYWNGVVAVVSALSTVVALPPAGNPVDSVHGVVLVCDALAVASGPRVDGLPTIGTTANELLSANMNVTAGGPAATMAGIAVVFVVFAYRGNNSPAAVVVQNVQRMNSSGWKRACIALFPRPPYECPPGVVFPII
jgi:hypothetical protein